MNLYLRTIYNCIQLLLLTLYTIQLCGQSLKLNEVKFRNGDKLLFCASDSQWFRANQDRQPAYRIDKRGNKLYNWYAISDARIIAPKGYHVPTRNEFINQKSSKDFDCNIDSIAKFIDCEILYYDKKTAVEGANTNGRVLFFWTADEVDNCNAYLLEKGCEYSQLDKKNTISSNIKVGKKFLGCYVFLFEGDHPIYPTEVNDNFTLNSQRWMNSNLDIDYFRNGDKMIQSNSFEVWQMNYETHTPTWCYYNFDTLNSRYGKIYNIWAVRDTRILAPEGWTIPTENDVKLLFSEYTRNKYITNANLYSDCQWESKSNPIGWWNRDVDIRQSTSYESNNFRNLLSGSLSNKIKYNSSKNDYDNLYIFQDEGNSDSYWTLTPGSSYDHYGGWNVYYTGKIFSFTPGEENKLLLEDVCSNNGYYIRCIRKVDSGYIGISVRPVDEVSSKSLKLYKVSGALVLDIIKDSPAEKAGIEPGDVILELDDKHVNTSYDLQSLAAQRRAGDKISLKIWRDGKSISKSVVLKKRDDQTVAKSENNLQLNLKYSLSTFNTEEHVQDYETWESAKTKKVWMKYNLNITKFRNGDRIIQATNMEEWDRALKNEEPAWCYFNFIKPKSKEDERKHGKLYNYYAVIDKRNIAPVGWSIPSSREYEHGSMLMSDVFVRSCRSKDQWKIYDYNDTFFESLFGKFTQNGFDIYPTGCFNGKDFKYLGERAYLWSKNSYKDVLVYEFRYNQSEVRKHSLVNSLFSVLKKQNYQKYYLDEDYHEWHFWGGKIDLEDECSEYGEFLSLGGYPIRCIKE